MSKPRQQHYIPKLLLRRFASHARKKGKNAQYYIYVFRKDGGIFPANIQNVGQTRDFYEDNASGDVEGRFGKLETNFGILLSELDEGGDPNSNYEELERFLWFHVIRHRTARLQIRDMAAKVFEGLGERGVTDDVMKIIHEKIEKEIESKIRVHIHMLPEPARSQFKRTWDSSVYRDMLMRFAKNKISREEVEYMYMYALKMMLEKLETGDLVSGAQVSALDGMLESFERPTNFKPEKWALLTSSEGKILLGDVCVFAVNSSGKCGSYFSFGEDWREIYFPISKNQVLWCCREDSYPTLNIDEINWASTKLSKECVYGSRRDIMSQEMLNHLGVDSDIATFEEVREAISSRSA